MIRQKINIKSTVTVKLLLFVLAFCFPLLTYAKKSKTYDEKVAYAKKIMASKSKEALNLLEQAILDHPMRSAAYIERGHYYYTYGENSVLAGLDFKRGVELITDLKQRSAKAEELTKMTSAVKSKKEQSFINKAIEYLDKGDAPKAISPLVDAVKVNRNNAQLYYYIGYALAEMKRYEQAVYYLERGRQICPMHKAVLHELLYVYGELNRQDQVEQTYHQIKRFYGDSGEISYELAYGYALSNDVEMAKAVLKDSISKYPGFLRSYFLLSEIYISSGQCHLAVSLLELFQEKLAVIDKDSGHPLAYKKEWYIEESKKMLKECNLGEDNASMD